MDKQTRRMLQSFFNQETEPYSESCWCPPVDICRGTNGWLVKIDLAGVRPEDVTVRASDHTLCVTGIRRDLSLLENQTTYSMEIAYNQFERHVELPIDLSAARLRSEYQDGMLMILITPGSSDDV